MMQHETPPVWQTASFNILLSIISGLGGAMLGGTIAALRNGAAHVTEACGMGIAGCGSSQHWAMWSVAIAVLFYVGGINSLILGSLYPSEMTSAYSSDLALVLMRWMSRCLDVAQRSPQFKQWVGVSLLVGVLGVAASAAIGGAVGGFVYGNFITGLGAAHGVPAIGWLFGMMFGTCVAGVSAGLFGGIAGVVSGVMLRQLPRSHRRLS